ncbi:hypothetical protein FOCG_08896 [Fusarium oxysporum f. sp. radicis-lycopersici 26381]|uniref:Zn(2)-C6 fungal-type domain-containing protein n=3 Tax=Fusarium oxysporum TaxID=5507 RepID=W9I3D5_FUSOX|nr:hypothetical protein FOYG_10232 [Fusarium oxysporum NRRL 32931]EWZ39097.1 hypothetical protein FOZG_08302 [Fusarium oxysporum Fo47]EWZ83941.1 hypothetical protein FOWG_12801 [Fusarium oxysporum f. sp. lycopersici MN25]EXL50653.1 hypothetical protein FOCG_08896 [Fusarium oxysporum f. sp. radicis-lycopersici 26381]EXL84094.1 hypothetical protein FOPG_03627 [Fusarium oxysporum f. sp. conglutinans race 2 54008]KAJ4034709.1 hypothetical protein NW758_010570 [Fusarium oxysporum]
MPVARHSCATCRRLKRKCMRELPSCSLCRRLGKKCEYIELPPPPTAPPPDGTSQPSLSEPNQPFPLAFFLDPDLFTPLTASNALAPGPRVDLQQIIAKHLEPDDLPVLYHNYFSSVHEWLPMISRKRITHPDPFSQDACHDLLLLCMKICTLRPNGHPPSQHPLYMLAKTLCAAAESAGLVSLRLAQSLVLLALYEACQAIYPACYLTISRAARLGILMSWHDRDAQQLFKFADSWSKREEQRRTWWTIFVLDRFISMDTSGLPFAAPEPCPDELLPVNDEDWVLGKTVPSEPLYTACFSSITTLGSFARTCQAAHMLGKVITHKHLKTKSSHDILHVVQEAQSLNRALNSLQISIEEQSLSNASSSSASSLACASAICISAQALLYGAYGCPDAPGITSRERLTHETELQSISVQGLRALGSTLAPKLAQIQSDCPLQARCFYTACSACSWFIREDDEPQMKDALVTIVDGLRRLAERWPIATEYISLLEQGGILRLIDTSSETETMS